LHPASQLAATQLRLISRSGDPGVDLPAPLPAKKRRVAALTRLPAGNERARMARGVHRSPRMETLPDGGHAGMIGVAMVAFVIAVLRK